MDLWIRSQNKEFLVKAEEINIHEDEDKTIHIWSDGTNKHLRYYLGSYKTKERALQVLDNIEFWITRTNENGQQLIIYEMPKE